MAILVSEMATIHGIAQVLDLHRPVLLDLPTHTRAAVALILRSGKDGPKMLFIERASRPDDPWSGDIGFPGGRMEEGENDPRQTAERETREEISLELGRERFLGRLSDISGVRMPVLVSCLVYAVGGHPPFIFSHEIRDAFWISIAGLTSPERHVMARVCFDGKIFESSAIQLPQPGKPVLWGITYRLVMEFLDLLKED